MKFTDYLTVFTIVVKCVIIPDFELAVAPASTGSNEKRKQAEMLFVNILRQIKRNCAMKRLLGVF